LLARSSFVIPAHRFREGAPCAMGGEIVESLLGHEMPSLTWSRFQPEIIFSQSIEALHLVRN